MEGKTESANLNTKYTLTKEQVQLLRKNELGSELQQVFDSTKARITQHINLLYITSNNCYPTPTQLKEHLTVAQTYLPIEKYISDFLKSTKAKKSSRTTYGLRVTKFKKYYNEKLKEIPLSTIINKTTIERYDVWLQHQYLPNTKPYGKAHIHDLKSTAIRLLNYIADEQNLTRIPFYLKYPKYNEQYTPKGPDFNKMINVECSGTTKLIQEMMYINSFIGLRIGELISVVKDNITFNDEYVSIHFTDFKNSSGRDVILMDKKGIELLRNHIYDSPYELVYKMSKSKFAYHLKRIAALALGDKAITLYNINTEENESHKIREIISSHSIRRYAIIENIGEYGITVAMTQSGHNNFQTVKKHYARDHLNQKAMINAMTRKNQV